MKKKTCSICHTSRPLSEFWRRPESVDGLRHDCIQCCIARHERWKADNPSRKAELDRAYHQKNKEHRLRYAARHYQENIEERRANNRQWRVDNIEVARAASRRRRQEKGDEVRAARRDHYRKNKGVYVANARKREQHIKRATPPWADLRAIEALYVRAEELTVRTGIRYSVDHYYPLKGKIMCGLHVPVNLRIIPHIWNIKKSNTEPVPTERPLCCAWPMAYPRDIHL